jgi:hypothetical protein
VNISKQLRDKILSIYNEQHKDKLDAMIDGVESVADHVIFPIMIDGVVDSIVFDMKEKRFSKIRAAIAKGEVSKYPFGDTSVYCDDTDTVDIDIPR